MKKILILIIAFLAGAVYAAPNCVAGKPCGNTCISRDKTCNIGLPPVAFPLPVQPPIITPAAPPLPSTPFLMSSYAPYDFDKRLATVEVPCGLPIDYMFFVKQTGEYLKFSTESEANDLLVSVKMDGIPQYSTAVQGEHSIRMRSLTEMKPIVFTFTLLNKNNGCPMKVLIKDLEVSGSK